MSLPDSLRRTLRRTRSPHTPMVVCGAGVNGLAYARSLGRRGVPVVLLDSRPQPGFRSRYAVHAELPAPHPDPAAWLAALDELADLLPMRPVLVATADVYVALISDHRDRLEARWNVLCPSADTVASILDKKRQYERAADARIPIPATCTPRSAAELEVALATLSYPSILKPCQAHVGRRLIGGAKVLVADDASALREAYTHIGHDAPFMIQEIVPGGDDQLVGYLGLWHHGEELAWLTKRKLRQSPPRFGDGSYQRTERLDDVAELSRRLLTAFGYHGLVGVEFKYDVRDGDYKLMEINPRTVSMVQLAVSAGVDFPWLAYSLATEGPEAVSCPRFREGMRYIHETWDLQAYLALRGAGELQFGPWWRSYHEAEVKALGAKDDPLPLLASVLSAAGRRLARR